MKNNTDKFNVVFLDLDGVCTSVDSGTHYCLLDDHSYKPAKELVERVKKLCDETNSKVVISSNWRRYDKNGTFTYNWVRFKSPLPKLMKMLDGYVYDTLPFEHGIRKAECTILWFEDHPDFKGRFVILDDADYEHFQTTTDHKINKSFLLIDPQTGFSEDDYKKAKKILIGRKSVKKSDYSEEEDAATVAGRLD